MLSADQIADLLAKPRRRRGDFSIVPLPDIAAIRSRGGTSIDLRLGRWFRSFKQTHITSVPLVAFPTDGKETSQTSRTREYFIPFDSCYILHPGRFVLGATLEWLSLPDDLSGYVTGKSALGRHGLVIETAAGIHPGFSGCLTLELANVGEVPLSLYPGMEICQIFLHAIKASKSHNRGEQSARRKPVLHPPAIDRLLDNIRSHLRQGAWRE